MFSFLNQLKSFTRTSNSSQNIILLDGGRASLEFFRAGKAFMQATIPPRLPSEMPLRTGDQQKLPAFPPQKSASIIPPLHWHAHQDETFLVVSGRMVATVSSRQQITSVNQEVIVRKCEYHTFSNASCDTDLVVDVSLNPDNRSRDEAFFRNAYGYLDDVRRAGRSPSLFQTLLFLSSADVNLALPGPKLIMAPLSKFIGWFGGVVIGKWVLGYQATYPEYTPSELSCSKEQ